MRRVVCWAVPLLLCQSPPQPAAQPPSPVPATHLQTRWAAQVTGRGACRHPDGAARLVNSALRVFAKEIRQHEHGRCTGDGAPVLPVPVVAGGVR